MQWLTAALAFATTMLFFAVVVSTFVEMIHRFLGLRERGLQLMLESLFSRGVEPQLKKVDPDSQLTAEQFARIIVANRAVVGAVDGSKSDREKMAELSQTEQRTPRLHPFFNWLLRPSQLTRIPVEIFTQKLVDSRIMQAADDKLELAIKDISQKYVAYGDEAREYFRRRARFLSVLVAFPVAWLFYVHPYDLAQAFIRDPELAERVAQYKVEYLKEQAKAGSSEQDGTTDSAAAGAPASWTPATAPAAPSDPAASIVLDVPPDAAGPGTPTDPAAPANPAAPADPDAPADPALPANPPAPATADGEDDPGEQAAEIARLKADLASLRERIQDWDKLDIPVGWPGHEGLKPCVREYELGCVLGNAFFLGVPRAVPSLGQIFWLFFGGLLIGLGAPFWAQAVSALSASREVSRKIARIVGDGDQDEGAEDERETGAETVALRLGPRSVDPTPVRTFKVARDAAFGRK